MASLKVNTVLHNAVVVAAAGADVTSSAVDCTSAFGSAVIGTITNGATGPTVGGAVIVQISADNVTWGDYQTVTGSTANSAVTGVAVTVPEAASYVRAIVGRNTGQSVTFTVHCNKITYRE